MSTSATKKYRRIALVYLILSVFFAIFGAIYEHFSFGVYSPFMIFAFAFPLIGGTLPALVISLIQPKTAPGQIAAWLYRCGIATLTIGSIIRGVLDIYGTTNALIKWYWRIGGAILLAGVLLHIVPFINIIIKNFNRTVDET